MNRKEDYQNISLELTEKAIENLEQIADEANCSVDDIINSFIDYGIAHYGEK